MSELIRKEVKPVEQIVERKIICNLCGCDAEAKLERGEDDSFVATVTEIAKRTHKSKAEVLRDAVNLYYKAIDEWETNRRGIVFQSIDENSGNKSATEEHCFA